jgi:hypothetical protein
MTVEVIDISHWQTTTPSLAGIGLVFCRASYGKYGDGSYPRHGANVRAAGKMLGAYHFGRNATASGDSVAEQVAAFLRVSAGAVERALDVEKDGTLPRMTNAQGREFIDRVQQQTGDDCGLYMSESAFQQLGQSFNWVANWSRMPAIPFRYWQYHGGPLDRDRFMGSLDTLRALVAPPLSQEDSDVMDGWTAPPEPSLITVPKGTLIYRSSEVAPDPLNRTTTSEHVLPFLGKVRNSRRELIWIVSYDNSADTSGWRSHFLKDKTGGYATRAVREAADPPVTVDVDAAEDAGYNAALDAVGQFATVSRRPQAVQAMRATSTATEGDGSLMGGMPKEVI